MNKIHRLLLLLAAVALLVGCGQIPAGESSSNDELETTGQSEQELDFVEQDNLESTLPGEKPEPVLPDEEDAPETPVQAPAIEPVTDDRVEITLGAAYTNETRTKVLWDAADFDYLYNIFSNVEEVDIQMSPPTGGFGFAFEIYKGDEVLEYFLPRGSQYDGKWYCRKSPAQPYELVWCVLPPEGDGLMDYVNVLFEEEVEELMDIMFS